MKISVLIPIYDKLTLTIKCIESLARFSFYFRESEVIIIDDGSTDGSAEYFTRYARENPWLIYHRNDSNQKFASSCNTGANLARGEFLIFLNNDTVVTENWDKHLLDTLEQDPNTWMVGAKLLFPNGTIQHAGVYLPELKGISFGHVYRGFPSYFPPADIEKELQCVTAACMIMRSADFQELGGFDTGFLNGSEDIDLCLRIISHGKKIRYQPKCVVIHYESQSEGRLNYSRQNAERLYNRWKDRVISDFRERVAQDIHHCISHGLMSEICHYSSEAGWTDLLAINRHLELNEKGNPVWIMSKESEPVKIPLTSGRSADELFIKLECNSSEKTYIRLQYKTKSGYEDYDLLNLKQNINEGNNLILFNLSKANLSEPPEMELQGKESLIEFISLSLYTYKNKFPARKPLLLILYHALDEPGQLIDLIEGIHHSGLGPQIELIKISDKLTTASINSTIASSDSDYILILEKGISVVPDFLIHAIEIMELQAKIGFVYGDILLNNDKNTSLFMQSFCSGNMLRQENIDMTGIYRKSCWESTHGYDMAIKNLRNLDLFLGINASGNWSGYKIKYPAFSASNPSADSNFDWSHDRDHISIKHQKYILKVCGKKIKPEQKTENKTEAKIPAAEQQDSKSILQRLISRLYHLLFK